MKSLNKLTSLKCVVKEQFYISKINSCKNDPAKLWKVINEILDSKPKTEKQASYYSQLVYSVVTDLDNAITDLKEISDMFNDFLVNIGPILCSKFRTSSTHHSALDGVKPSLKAFFFEHITPAEVFCMINQLNSKKANGLENIAVKYYRPKLANEYTLIFLMKFLIHVHCTVQGLFSYELKLAKVRLFQSSKVGVTLLQIITDRFLCYHLLQK